MAHSKFELEPCADVIVSAALRLKNSYYPQNNFLMTVLVIDLKLQENKYIAKRESAARQQIIGGGAPINKSRRRQQIVGGGTAGAVL